MRLKWHCVALDCMTLHWVALVGIVLNMHVLGRNGLALIALDGIGLGVIRRVVVDWIELE